MTQYPNSLLVRIYGLYSIETSSSTAVYYVVMEHLHSPSLPLIEKYDLKGNHHIIKISFTNILLFNSELFFLLESHLEKQHSTLSHAIITRLTHHRPP